jgi:hypothetical protein
MELVLYGKFVQLTRTGVANPELRTETPNKTSTQTVQAVD